jgi:hypothetical protein
MSLVVPGIGDTIAACLFANTVSNGIVDDYQVSLTGYFYPH